LRLPDCPGFQGFKLRYASIVSHCLFGKVCGEGLSNLLSATKAAIE
jgi:hypothetical protein